MSLCVSCSSEDPPAPAHSLSHCMLLRSFHIEDDRGTRITITKAAKTFTDAQEGKSDDQGKFFLLV